MCGWRELSTGYTERETILLLRADLCLLRRPGSGKQIIKIEARTPSHAYLLMTLNSCMTLGKSFSLWHLEQSF